MVTLSLTWNQPKELPDESTIQRGLLEEGRDEFVAHSLLVNLYGALLHSPSVSVEAGSKLDLQRCCLQAHSQVSEGTLREWRRGLLGWQCLLRK